MKHHLTETQNRLVKFAILCQPYKVSFQGNTTSYIMLLHYQSGTSPTNHRLTHRKAGITFFEGGGGCFSHFYFWKTHRNACRYRGGSRILQLGQRGGGARCMLNHLWCAVGPLQSQKILNFRASWGGGGLKPPKPPPPPTGSATAISPYKAGFQM